MIKIILITAILIPLSLLFTLARPVSAAAIISEPSFETLTNWTYDEEDSDYAGIQSIAWTTQGTNSYLLSTPGTGLIANKKHAMLFQSVDFTSVDTISFDIRLRADNNGYYEAALQVGTSVVWAQSITTSQTDYLHQEVDVSGYTGVQDLHIHLETIATASSIAVEAYFDNIKIWGSYSDATWQTVTNSFSDSTNHVYMYGENFDSGTTKVGYYDGGGTLRQTDTYSSFGGGALDESECLFTDWPLASEGTWHAVVSLQADDLPNTYAGAIADPDYITDDDFYIASSAIPEFPTAISAIVAAGLCFVIYYWMRRRLEYAKA